MNRYTTIVYQRETLNVLTREKTIYPRRYGVYDNQTETEVVLIGFNPTTYEEVKAKASELNDLEDLKTNHTK